MSVKLVMTWDIVPDREQEYFEFVIGEFIPGIQRMGLKPVEAWATLYGDYPQIQVSMLAEDIQGAKRFLISEGWNLLHNKLTNFIQNYACKVVPASNGFQF